MFKVLLVNIFLGLVGSSYAADLALESWAKRYSRSGFYDAKTGRIVLEKKGEDPWIFLLGSPFALKGEQFIKIKESPNWKENKVWISEAAMQSFLAEFKDSGLKERESKALKAVADNKEKNAEKHAKEPAKLIDANDEGKKSVQKGDQVSQQTGDDKSGCKNGRDIKKIFIDPGHGGYDFGTQKKGINEKDVVLRFSKLVGEQLKNRGFDVNFSRTKDIFLPLEIRNQLAQEWKADAFISLHVNSNPASSAHGTETYILSQEATDAAARKLALLENSIVQKAKEKQSAVQDILWDMEQTSYLQESAYLAAEIQRSIVKNAHDLLEKKKAGDWTNRGVRQAPFFVLNRAAMPAVLVELGYLSNDHDRKLLVDKIFQERLAKALADGVTAFKAQCR